MKEYFFFPGYTYHIFVKDSSNPYEGYVIHPKYHESNNMSVKTYTRLRLSLFHILNASSHYEKGEYISPTDYYWSEIKEWIIQDLS